VQLSVIFTYLPSLQSATTCASNTVILTDSIAVNFKPVLYEALAGPDIGFAVMYQYCPLYFISPFLTF
jgi:hypothetical protein